MTEISPPSPWQVISLTNTQTGHCNMASRGGATRPNGPNAGNKICQFKLVLLGESAVGKSSLVLRFVKGQFHEFQESTIGGMLSFTFWTKTLSRRKVNCLCYMVKFRTVALSFWYFQYPLCSSGSISSPMFSCEASCGTKDFFRLHFTSNVPTFQGNF